jgi:adenosylcobyric acid synthase
MSSEKPAVEVHEGAGTRPAMGIPEPGAHGGDAVSVARALGVDPEAMIDLSVSMNPFAPDLETLALRHLGELRRYPDASVASASLAEVLDVDPSCLVLTNGGSEAIHLAGGWIKHARLLPQEFSLLRESLEVSCGEDCDAPLARSNPNNPTGELAPAGQRAALWDEAFYQMTTGSWTRRDFESGSLVVGSLTKLFHCPGLRLGYLIAPSEEVTLALASKRPAWQVNGLASALCPVLLERADLGNWARSMVEMKQRLAEELQAVGFQTTVPDAPWLLATWPGLDAAFIRRSLAQEGILVRSCASFGMPDVVRVGLPHPRDLPRLEEALGRLELSPKASIPRPRSNAAREPSRFGRGVLVAGTGSDVGKSVIVTGILRALNRRGLKVVPFKAQNMSLNSAVVGEGEMARAQFLQAQAAGMQPALSMNPVLLKPTGERTSQLVVMGKALWEGSARDYQREKQALWPVVLDALSDLAAGADLVVCEGAGGAAEINLIQADLGNLPLAKRAGYPAWVVGDIDKGGVFAALAGTYWMLPKDLRATVRGFLVNKMRGDPSLLAGATKDLEAATGVPTLGVLPYLDARQVDAEDSLWLDSPGSRASWEPSSTGHSMCSAERGGMSASGQFSPSNQFDVLDVAVVRYPRIANFSDFDPLRMEPSVRVRFVSSLGELGEPDLVVLPGSKATVSDLAWLSSSGIANCILSWARRPDAPVILGICAGYQILGEGIDDRFESKQGIVRGLGLLPVETTFEPDKLLRRRSGIATLAGATRKVEGYEMRNGRPRLALVASGAGGSRRWSPSEGPLPGARPWIFFDDGYGCQEEGALRQEPSLVLGTSLHGLFENDELRFDLLSMVAKARGKVFAPSGLSFGALREEWIDHLADMVETHLDLSRLVSDLIQPTGAKGGLG